MHRMVPLTLALLLAFGLGGCGGSKPVHYYAAQLPATPSPANNPHAVSLLVAGVNGADIFRQTPIAYRVGENEIGTYQYSRWEEAPVTLLRGRLIRILIASGNYQSVSELGGGAEGQYVVKGRLYDFEEVDTGSIVGLVSMEFDLFDKKSGKVVWSHHYTQSEPVHSKEISAVVTALDINLERGLREVAAGIDQYFSGNPPGKS